MSGRWATHGLHTRAAWHERIKNIRLHFRWRAKAEFGGEATQVVGGHFERVPISGHDRKNVCFEGNNETSQNTTEVALALKSE